MGIDPADVEKIHFYSSDGGHSEFNGEYFTEPRYFYPGIFSGEEGRAEVASMLALQRYEERTSSDADPAKMCGADGIGFCFGQDAITDKVSIQYGKYINKITLVLRNGSRLIVPDKPYGTGISEYAGTDSASGGAVQIASGADGRTPAEEEDIDRGLTADTLTITVGYYGGPYTVKKVFTLEELYRMKPVDQVYSYIDNMPAVVLESARGIRLRDLLMAAGIDVNSVESFHFYCSDVKTSWYQSIGKDYLLDTVRYYYPKLQESWNYDESAAGPEAMDSTAEVETMIALEDNWKRFAVAPDFGHLAKKSRFRLVFGQTDTETKNAYRSARWIHTIEVMLGGKPPETGESQAVPAAAEVGSKLRHDDTPGNADGDQTAGVQNWRVYEMSGNAIELPAAETESPLMPVICVAAALILILGIAYGIIRFYREV